MGWTAWHDRLHRRLLRQPHWLPQGGRLLLALSGGQDSMALLALGLAYAQWRWLECPARHLLRNRLGQGTGPRRLVLRSLRPETLPDTPVADDGVCKR
ncbi:tRNA(Ile)-lysidine synthetase [Synechococcus sp. BMK-MC-1]|jgi:hypothetical protein|nr:tRNA(Ile)-lysidine synthetase [Synechococcus sp. BMK-MC-1]